MNYQIKIDGGFSGIPEIYEGEIASESEEVSRFMKLLQKLPPPGNPDLRDALHYRITLQAMGKEASAVFNDAQLPGELRQLVDRIRSGYKM
jgi:hypothetical protein